jgi:hypothetical protein
MLPACNGRATQQTGWLRPFRRRETLSTGCQRTRMPPVPQAGSSVAERAPYTRRVAGSNPVPPTTVIGRRSRALGRYYRRDIEGTRDVIASVLSRGEHQGLDVAGQDLARCDGITIEQREEVAEVTLDDPGVRKHLRGRLGPRRCGSLEGPQLRLLFPDDVGERLGPPHLGEPVIQIPDPRLLLLHSIRGFPTLTVVADIAASGCPFALAPTSASGPG